MSMKFMFKNLNWDGNLHVSYSTWIEWLFVVISSKISGRLWVLGWSVYSGMEV